MVYVTSADGKKRAERKKARAKTYCTISKAFMDEVTVTYEGGFQSTKISAVSKSI